MKMIGSIMATQASGYLQKKLDSARQCDIQRVLGRVRAADCCKSEKVSDNYIASASSLLNARLAAYSGYSAPQSGISNTLYLKQKVDNLVNEFDRVYPKVVQDQWVGAPPCPPDTIYYHAGEGIPVPRFRCNLLNNMSHE